MSELCIPLDFEQLSELWQLRSALASKGKDLPQKQIEQSAIYIFCRLFVTLGYLARSTNEPGYLSCAGAPQFLSSLEPLYGDDCKVLELLETSKILEVIEDGRGWYCPMFARMNPHLAGNYKPKEVKGNINSRVSAHLSKVTGDVERQCMLFPAEFFTDATGERMSDTDCKRSMILIQMLDRCLDKPQRLKSQFTPGLMTSACGSARKYEPDALRNFYFWLANNRDHPAVPASAELLLENFDKFLKLSRG